MAYNYLEPYIIGVDEVGRGALCHSVVASAAVLPFGFNYPKLRDSKKMASKEREAFFDYAPLQGALFGIGSADVHEIERLNIRRATHLAMHRAIKDLMLNNPFINSSNCKIIVDGNDFVTNEDWNFTTLIKGDDLVKSISAASCYAKVYRDNQMKELSRQYDDRYGWNTNSGYGTLKHKRALIEHGITDQHRPSFVKTLLSK